MFIRRQLLLTGSLSGILTLTACGSGSPVSSFEPGAGSEPGVGAAIATPFVSVETTDALLVIDNDRIIPQVTAAVGDDSNGDSGAVENVSTAQTQSVAAQSAPDPTPSSVNALQTASGQVGEFQSSTSNITDESENVPDAALLEASKEVTAQAEAAQYITIGRNPGDAQCMVLGQRNVGFGSAQLSDWGAWLGGDPRFFIGREFLAVEDDADYGKVLRQRYVPNYKGTEWVATGKNIEGHRTYRVVQSIFFEEGWDWGGEWPYQTGKLGFGFGSGTYPTGGKIDPKGFTSRLIWRGNRDGGGRLAVYSYAADRPDEYGEDIDIGDVSIGRWHEVVMEVTANSSTQKSDGSVRVWLDGELKVERYNMGWQLAGNQPLIDQLFYMSFYGGHGTVWSPNGNKHMRITDACWAPVVDGYSGIDPDNGVTKIDPAERNVPILNDDTGAIELDQFEKGKRAALGSIGALSLQLNLLSIQGSADLSSALSQAGDELNLLGDELSEASEFFMPEDPISRLQAAYDQLEMSDALLASDATGLKSEISRFQDRLLQLVFDVSELGLSLAEDRAEANGCAGDLVTGDCSRILQHIDEAKAHRSQLQIEIAVGSYDAFSAGQQAWHSSRLAMLTLE